MPNKRNSSSSSRHPRSPQGLQQVWYPIAYVLSTTGPYTTTVETLSRVFDRARAFRLLAFRYEVSSSWQPTKGLVPFIVQVDLYGPQSSSDTVWSSPLTLVGSTGTTRRSLRWPGLCALWFPSDTSSSTPLLRFTVTCERKDQPVAGLAQAYLLIELGAWEDDGSCPSVIVYRDRPVRGKQDDPPSDDEGGGSTSSFVELSGPPLQSSEL